MHKVLELYAQARKDGLSDWRLDWNKNLIDAYFGKLDGFNTPNNLFILMFENSKNQQILGAPNACEQCTFNCMDNITDCPKKIFENSIDIMAYVINRYDKAFGKNCIGIEQEFNIEIGEHKGQPIVINGFMDVVFQLDKDTIEVVDYKSGTYTKSYSELLEDNQAGIYSLAVKHKYPGFNNYFLTFDYFTKSPITVTFTDEQDLHMKKRVIQIFKDIKDNNHPRRIPLNRDGSLFYKCQYMCHRPTCDKQWEIFQRRYGRSGL
jgi:hypothetical protein